MSPEVLERLRRIQSWSRQVNGPSGADHGQRLLEFVRHHADEIQALYDQGDPHGVTETGDLLILCLELIMEQGADIESVLLRCLGRFERKLQSLAADASLPTD